jgi:hypothetical protein
MMGAPFHCDENETLRLRGKTLTRRVAHQVEDHLLADYGHILKRVPDVGDK